MKLRSCQIPFSIKFQVEALGVLVALLPVGVFATSTMNNGRWFHQGPTVELAQSVARAASETGLGRVHYRSHESTTENQEHEPERNFGTAETDFSQAPADSVMDEVDEYLWAVYERTPTKQDSTGDFTWKDAAAAARLGMSVKTYVIGGMDPDLRELLYHAGLAIDAAGIHWTILSAFRDDYRQSLTSGFKAHTNNSLHGGSAATGGYGHGCAVDIKDADGNSDVWRWVDGNSAKIGLQRLLPRADPAHVQPRGAWHRFAAALRNYRLGSDEAAGETVTIDTTTGSATAPSETEAACINLRHWEDDSSRAKRPTGLVKAKGGAQFAKISR